jgi:GT2 family glycosyltransferase
MDSEAASVMSGVTVVVPNWNRRDLLERLLGNLARQSHPIQEIVVADNGSTDGSAEMASAAGAHVIQMGRNAGFSPAVNCGIRAARTPWLAIVNNDVEPAVDWLERLLEAAGREEIWFATGKLLNAARRDRMDGAFDMISQGGCSWRAGHGRPDGPAWAGPRKIRFAPLTAALFRTELFERVGLLDERFESYLEDVDFGLRCAKKGYWGVYAPEAAAYHAGSATLGAWHAETVRRISRNQLLLVAKHFPKGWVWRYGWPVAVGQTLWGLVALRHGAAWAFARGKLEAFGQFRAVRATAKHEAQDIGQILEESERELFRLQQETGFDLYWRLYFALT